MMTHAGPQSLGPASATATVATHGALALLCLRLARGECGKPISLLDQGQRRPASQLAPIARLPSHLLGPGHALTLLVAGAGGDARMRAELLSAPPETCSRVCRLACLRATTAIQRQRCYIHMQTLKTPKPYTQFKQMALTCQKCRVMRVMSELRPRRSQATTCKSLIICLHCFLSISVQNTLRLVFAPRFIAWSCS